MAGLMANWWEKKISANRIKAGKSPSLLFFLDLIILPPSLPEKTDQQRAQNQDSQQANQ
jgi:hypothetical protein